MKLTTYFSGGITPGTVKASKAAVPDSNKDLSGFRHLGLTGNLTVTAGGSVKSSVANLFAGFIPAVVQQALSGAGAVNLTTYYTALTTTGANALTLADGTVIGQLKKIQMIVDAGDGTLTFNGTSTIVFADVGDTAELMWNGSDWIPIALYNCADGATAPVYTP